MGSSQSTPTSDSFADISQSFAITNKKILVLQKKIDGNSNAQTQTINAISDLKQKIALGKEKAQNAKIIAVLDKISAFTVSLQTQQSFIENLPVCDQTLVSFTESSENIKTCKEWSVINTRVQSSVFHIPQDKLVYPNNVCYGPNVDKCVDTSTVKSLGFFETFGQLSSEVSEFKTNIEKNPGQSYKSLGLLEPPLLQKCLSLQTTVQNLINSLIKSQNIKFKTKTVNLKPHYCAQLSGSQSWCFAPPDFWGNVTNNPYLMFKQSDEILGILFDQLRIIIKTKENQATSNQSKLTQHTNQLATLKSDFGSYVESQNILKLQIGNMQETYANDLFLNIELEEEFVDDAQHSGFQIFTLKSNQKVIQTMNTNSGSQQLLAVPSSVSKPLQGAKIIRLMTNSANTWSNICATVPFKPDIYDAATRTIRFKWDKACGCGDGWTGQGIPGNTCVLKELAKPSADSSQTGARASCANLQVLCNDGSSYVQSSHGPGQWGNDPLCTAGCCTYSHNRLFLPKGATSGPFGAGGPAAFSSYDNNYDGNLWNYSCGGHGGVRSFRALGGNSIACSGNYAPSCGGSGSTWALGNNNWHEVSQGDPKACETISITFTEKGMQLLGGTDIMNLSIGVVYYYQHPPQAYELYGCPTGFTPKISGETIKCVSDSTSYSLYVAQSGETTAQQQQAVFAQEKSLTSAACTPPKMNLEWFGAKKMSMSQSGRSLAAFMVFTGTSGSWPAQNAAEVKQLATELLTPSASITATQNATANGKTSIPDEFVVPCLDNSFEEMADVWVKFDKIDLQDEAFTHHVTIENYSQLPKSLQTLCQQALGFFGASTTLDKFDCEICGSTVAAGAIQTFGSICSCESPTRTQIVALLMINLKNKQNIATYVQNRAKKMATYSFPHAWVTNSLSNTGLVIPIDVLQLHPSVKTSLQQHSTINGGLLLSGDYSEIEDLSTNTKFLKSVAGKLNFISTKCSLTVWNLISKKVIGALLKELVNSGISFI